MSDDRSAQFLPPTNELQSNADGLHIFSSDVEEKFAKKMKQVGLHEKEIETVRMASSMGYPHVDLERFPVSQQALRQIPRTEAEANSVVCFYYTQDEVRVGAVNPSDAAVQEIFFQVQERTHAHGVLYAISKRSFDRVLLLYDRLPVVKAITKDIEIKAEDIDRVEANVKDFRQLQTLLESRSTTDTLTFLLGAALKLNASDLHVEAEEKGIAIRLRLDGVLHDAATLPKASFKQFISRIKLVSSLKINITDKPQDGRLTIKLKDTDVDVRVSTMPTVYGESVVMRLLRQSRQGLSLDKIGLRGDVYERLKREIERPNGMIITTGPTGSGKTTTLYAIMQILNQPGVKIITLEDPVEYHMKGVNQSQIDPEKDYTFAKALRSILRQDPDIAMVGEIRDLETADIAIQASLTGHLMLSTIHTNNAAGAIPRFLSMGVKPFLLAPALRCVIGQRLVRRLCGACKSGATLKPDHAERVKVILAALPPNAQAAIAGKEVVFFSSKGCDACNGLGYNGRVGIYEILIMTEAIEKVILSGKVSEYDMQRLAVGDGMITMVQDGILKALDGMTSVEEVFSVIE